MTRTPKNISNIYPYRALAFSAIWSAVCIGIIATWAWLNFKQSWLILGVICSIIYVFGICILTNQIKKQYNSALNYKLLYLSALWPIIPIAIVLVLLIIKYIWWWQQISVHSKDGTFSSIEWFYYTLGIPTLMCIIGASVAPNLFAIISHGSFFVKCCRENSSSTTIKNTSSPVLNRSSQITPLLDTILSKNPDLVRAALQDYPEQLNTAYAKNGNTPLHVAALNGHTEIVRLLLAQPNIDKTRTNNVGRTALDLAREKGFEDIIKLLQ